MKWLRSSLLAAVLGLALAASPVLAAPAVHVFPTVSARNITRYDTPTTPLIYNGGPIITTPHVHIVVWGDQWGTQYSGTSYSNDPYSEVPNTVAFFQGLGTNSETWSGVISQFSSPSQGFINYSSNLFAGVIYDNRGPAIDGATQTDFADETAWAETQVPGSGPNDIYVILSPTGNTPYGFGSQYCAYHSASYDLTPYINQPYVTDQGQNCGANFINSYIDGQTIVVGHEYAETVTDPVPQTGWYDWSNGMENADICAWIYPGHDGAGRLLGTATGGWAVQALGRPNTGVCDAGAPPPPPPPPPKPKPTLTLHIKGLKVVRHGNTLTITVTGLVRGARVHLSRKLGRLVATSTTTSRGGSVVFHVRFTKRGTYQLTATATGPNDIFRAAHAREKVR